MSDRAIRTIEIGALTRVEGEGALRVSMKDGIITDVQLAIYEPPRFFEALLRGRPLEETPDITARICGICPIAYQMTTVHALETALRVRITPEIRVLRRLLYCGEWIESHGVHMHLLHIPDFFGYQSSIELAKRFPEQVNRGLRLKKIGNRILEVMGGRAVHPINVAVGGFHKGPPKAELQALLPDLHWGLDAAIIAQGMANRAGRLSPTPSQRCRSNPSTRRTLPMSLIRRYSAANGLGITTPTTRAGHSPRGRDIFD